MGLENMVELGNCTLYLNGEPVAWGQGELPGITVREEGVVELAGVLVCEPVEFTVHFKTPKRWRCRRRKRFIKLMMSEGVSRNNAERLADFTRGLMSYKKAWGNHLLHKA